MQNGTQQNTSACGAWRLETLRSAFRLRKAASPFAWLKSLLKWMGPGWTCARQGLLKAVEACLLHRTLVEPPLVKVSLRSVTRRNNLPRHVSEALQFRRRSGTCALERRNPLRLLPLQNLSDAQQLRATFLAHRGVLELQLR